MGFDLWQVRGGTIFDNILITDDVSEADVFAKKWKELSTHEKTKVYGDSSGKYRYLIGGVSVCGLIFIVYSFASGGCVWGAMMFVGSLVGLGSKPAEPTEQTEPASNEQTVEKDETEKEETHEKSS